MRIRISSMAAVVTSAWWCGAALAGGWSLSAGPTARFGMDVGIRGSSRVHAQGVHAAAPYRSLPGMRSSGPSYRYASGTPDLSGYADRSYDDGFVFMDPGTADPNSLVPGLTWNWGYTDASQYDPSADTLSFHRLLSGIDVQSLADVSYGEELTRTTLRDTPVSLDDDMSGAGIGISASGSLLSRDALELALCVGFNAIWGAGSHMEASTFEERLRLDRIRVDDSFTYTDTHTYRDTYTYDTMGVTPPPAPYSGTYAGGGQGQDPVIPNIPSSYQRDVAGSQRQTASTRRTRIDGTSYWRAANRIAFDVDAELYDLWIGPKAAVTLGERLALFAIPSVSLNYIQVDASRTEDFTAAYPDGRSQVLQSWRDSESEGAWIAGLGLAAGAEVRIADGWFAGLQGGYDWLLDDVDVTVGPNTISVDPSGWTLALRAGRAF